MHVIRNVMNPRINLKIFGIIQNRSSNPCKVNKTRKQKTFRQYYLI